MTLPTATELLRQWDAARPRSQQTEMGMSRLGSCRRQAGYHLGGYPADEGYEPNDIQAILGTSIHMALAEAAAMFLPGARSEDLEVHFASLRGHPDLYLDGVLRDYKTVGYGGIQLEQRRQNGPWPRERYQAHMYAAGAIMRDLPVHTIEIVYIARDSGDEFTWSEPFDMAVVREALAWLEQVSTAPVSTLPRDYRPESVICQGCEFFRRCWNAEPGKDPRSVLFLDHPDAADWALKLEDAQARRKQAEADEKDAKGALDALRTVSRPGEREYVRVPGLDREIRFRMDKGRQSPDMPRIAVDYRNAGARPPMRQGDPIVNVALVKPQKREKS